MCWSFKWGDFIVKIKLKVTHEIDGKESISYAEGIREENKITYFDDHMKVVVDIKEDEVDITILNNIENHMCFGKNTIGYYIVEGKRLDYNLETLNLSIEENKVAIDYKIEYISRYILEVINDWKNKRYY